MLSLYLLRCLIPLLFFDLATATEKQCHYDCRQVSSRLVGPTRPYHDVDALGNPLRLTRPYPYHKASTTEGYDFPRFCELGCTYFYVSSGAGMNPSWPSDKSTLDRCMEQCDDTYRYNVTVGYNDLLETIRLECRDGCQIALIRCQPGYYCLQASPAPDKIYSGGDMLPCPAGTYRDVAYEQVSECVPCPPNHFREGIKGRSLSGCSKCPANTSSRQRSTSITDCVRCPAGKTSTAGSSCKCITPQACDENQLPFPADAEKRDSVPFIGRW